MATSFKKNLVTAHEYSLKVKPPHSVVSVKNLSTQAYVGGSRWGVSEDALRNQLQPLFISSRLSFAKPFTSAAVADVVDDTTVNYSTLSKAILKAVEVRGDDASGLVGRPKFGLDWTLYDLLDWIDIYLTGRSLSGALVQDLRGRLVERGVLAPKPLLKVDGFEELGFTVFLPKATLLSEGVSLTTSNEPWRSDSYCSVLKIHNIRIPTLIGVNANERLAKQMLVISVEIDPYVCRRHDCYNELEQIVVKTTEESSFETLETLASVLCDRVIKYFIHAYLPFREHLANDDRKIPVPEARWSQVKVTIEKPCAVMFAESPSIEVTRSASPLGNQDAPAVYEQWMLAVKASPRSKLRIPFPLQGKLSSWIASHGVGESSVE